MQTSRIKIRYIAKQLQVTSSTVSDVLINHSFTSEAIKKPVNERAEWLNCSRSRIGSSRCPPTRTNLGFRQEWKRTSGKISETIRLINFSKAAFPGSITFSHSILDQLAKRIGEKAAKLFFHLSSINETKESVITKRVLESLLTSPASRFEKIRKKDTFLTL